MDHLIYHPKREVTVLDNGLTVHHDNFGGNEDPYVWNEKFLHTYCHITELSNKVGQINFWVSGDTFPEFNALYCDLVFVVGEKLYWKEANRMRRNDPIVDTDLTYEHNLKWGDAEYGHHQLSTRRRYTLKAHPDKSFQPQNENGELIDIVPFFLDHGYTIEDLRSGLRKGYAGKPYKLMGDLGKELYDYLNIKATVKLKGIDLMGYHPEATSAQNSTCCSPVRKVKSHATSCC